MRVKPSSRFRFLDFVGELTDFPSPPESNSRKIMNILMRSFLTLIASLVMCTPVLAQQITGQVRYVDTGQAAFNVLVRCDGSGGRSQTFTDRSGNFRFGVGPGRYTVSINHTGYKTEEQSIELIDNGSSEHMFFRLRPDPSGVKTAPNATTLDANVPAAARKEFEKAEAALASGKKEGIEESIIHLEKAVSIYPKFVQAELKLGTVYMDLGQWDKAEQALRMALECDPKAANALFALGEIYLRQKKDEEAEKVLLQGLQMEDGSFQGHLTLGRVYWDMALKIKDERQARPYLEKSYDQVKQALNLNPKLAQAHLLKGNLLLRVHRAPDALNEFEEYLRLEPKGQFAEQTQAVVERVKKALASQKN
jgi:tetratricopeptide (TPR) repeat protein